MTNNKIESLPHTIITDVDIYLLKQGTHFRLFEKLGSRTMTINGVKGTYFAVWAPNATQVSVIGDFNGWNRTSHPLFVRWDSSGIWEGFITGVEEGALYKYVVKSQHFETEKGDPFAFAWEEPPRTASIVWNLDYQWNDANWNGIRAAKNDFSAPMSIYELHFGSWQRKAGNQSLTYREMAEILPKYLQEMGFTHVEFMPLMEHPFYGSWGYQKIGYFAPSRRYGTPQDFMYLIDKLHQHEIGVLLDWVPSHFPSDVHGLANFDGTALYEHADPRKGFHPEWKSYIFNYGRNEVRCFLISSAIFWLQKYRLDGLRVDAVSSMLYLDYARTPNEWIPNVFGGHENLEAISFLKQLNEYVYESFPYIQMIAEESTAWPMVSRPTSVGGLGFGLKWNMGWMHDTLEYFTKDPVHRKYHHGTLLFNLYYLFSENFVLSLSHDEVVYGKRSLLNKMPGDDWQKFGNLRLLYSYMFTHPGKKLLFMGAEIGQWDEWNHETSLDWHLLAYDRHQGIKKIVRDLNFLYRNEKALHNLEMSWECFEWVNMYDSDNSVLSFFRKDPKSNEVLLVICNFTPVPRENYTLGLNRGGHWKEIFNSDAAEYGGTNQWRYQTIEARADSNAHLFTATLPPLSTMVFKQLL